MTMFRRSITCDRVRSQVSLELDGLLSQLERPMLTAHVARCPDCRAYRNQVHALTGLLRAAPLEPLDAPLSAWRPRRRLVPARLPAAAAAAMAFAIVGLGTQLMVAGRTEESTLGPSLRTGVTRFPSPAEVRQEMKLVETAHVGDVQRSPMGGFFKAM